MNEVLGYKVFNSDWTCRGFQFEVGKTYTQGGKLELCSNGFHFCRKANKCFDYYSFDSENRVAIIRVLGNLVGDENDNEATNIIEIVEEVTWEKLLTIVNIGHSNSGHSNSGHSNSGHSNSGHSNSGHSNSGDWNSGDWNSGHSNSGDWNSGDWNSGHSNSGDWNSGHRNSGYFNSENPEEILSFNRPCKKEIWDACDKPSFIFNIDINKWIYLSEMSDKEKELNPNFYVLNGYLKTISYKEAWMNAFLERRSDDIEKLKALPNFNKDVFFEITGIDIDKF